MDLGSLPMVSSVDFALINDSFLLDKMIGGTLNSTLQILHMRLLQLLRGIVKATH